VLGVSLLVETSLAFGSTRPSVAQETGAVPSSGALLTSTPAPVSVPPSGSFASNSHPFTAFATTAGPIFQSVKRVAGPPIRRRHLHREVRRHNPVSALRARSSESVAPSVVDRETAEPLRDGARADSFLLPFGKGKE
jgi:hypothetical protein